MANNRIFYACQAVAIGSETASAGGLSMVHGVQSVGVNTTFNLEQVFELGQISIYENIEGVPDIEVTIEKVLDGYPLIYLLATSGAVGNSLVNRTKKRCSVALGIWPDDKDAVSGAPLQQIYMSGMYVNSISYTLPVDGNCTESVTLVGNHKVWNDGKLINTDAAELQYNNDQPAALATEGGVQRRENVLLGPKLEDGSSVIPSSIINSQSTHIQSITISTDLGREDIFELGRKAPYYRAPNFPVEVTCEFEVISVSGDKVNAYEEGDPAFNNTVNEGNNTIEENIVIQLQDGTTFDLGTKNRLSSVTYGGGDAGGGNSTMTFSYSTFNDLTVTQS